MTLLQHSINIHYTTNGVHANTTPRQLKKVILRIRSLCSLQLMWSPLRSLRCQLELVVQKNSQQIFIRSSRSALDNQALYILGQIIIKK